ncbi:MAG: hypothetical protein ABEJ43_05150 [Haloferacaceae archaeon]
MARDDRLHAQPPSHDVERWTEGRVVGVEKPPGRAVVTVRPEPGGDGEETVELYVSEAVYDLFVGRVAEADRSDGDVSPGAPVWYRKRGQTGRP